MADTERLTADSTMDYRKFIDSLYVLLCSTWGEDEFSMTMKRPNVHEDVKNATMPIITYVLKETTPGEINNEGKVERRPRKRENRLIINDNGEREQVGVYGQVFDHYIEFTIYAQNNDEALTYSESFRDVIDKYKGCLQKWGMQNMWLVKEYERSGNEQRRDDMATRGIDYFVRLEKITLENKTEIERIALQADTYHDKLKKEGRLPSQTNN